MSWRAERVTYGNHISAEDCIGLLFFRGQVKRIVCLEDHVFFFGECVYRSS